MANIRPLDMQMLNQLFGFSSSYVLDFTNRSFSEFFSIEVGIDIDSQKYLQIGTSKGKRLRAFLEAEPEPIVGRALRALWEYREALHGPSGKQDDKALHQEQRFFDLVHEMDGKGAPRQPSWTPAQAAGPSRREIEALNAKFQELMTMKAQDRGFAFESFLSDMFALYGLAPRRSFRNTGEQIDGSFELIFKTYLLEAKWQDAKIGIGDLLIFAGKVDGKAEWARGLFVSYSGFSDDGLHAFARGRRTNIVCLDGLDLVHVLSGGLNLVEVIQKKDRRSVETNNAFVPVRDLFPSVT